MDAQCTNDVVLAIVGIVIAATTLTNVITSYYRHKTIVSDNQRILHVIEGKTQFPSDVK